MNGCSLRGACARGGLSGGWPEPPFASTTASAAAAERARSRSAAALSVQSAVCVAFGRSSASSSSSMYRPRLSLHDGVVAESALQHRSSGTEALGRGECTQQERWPG